ncbi:rhodanese-like domain-containing protein [Arcicella aquatica]|uniref:Rhodanese-like domain-containing protein n=1 Tax=Arcicella aquatica TaxID=217141 RepID=A0ABU5QR71_9BACT|nr:rhodanese-like domain-containing protein [Arcicella aquatica]MEA5259518.1 rhodanese-like domain-containing protein [Arcicella aquatica]
MPTSPIIDVRTSDKFSKGHLQKAKNVDWNNKDFDKQVTLLDKSKPVFVYCLSGGRSSSAANQMRRFKKNKADKVVVIRINADDNQALCKELKIGALPILQVFKNQKLTWSNIGFIDKKEVEKEL